MRINKYIAFAIGLSRRGADEVIGMNRVTVNGQRVTMGFDTRDGDVVMMDDKVLTLPQNATTILLNKPTGYVCSRDGQGSATIYELLPKEYEVLKPVGRLDKDSSGLLMLTNDGTLANRLAHPSNKKNKRYEVALDKPLTADDKQALARGVMLDDGHSQLQLQIINHDPRRWEVSMHEGRNRQIRRTFAVKGYTVTQLERLQFGSYTLDGLKPGDFKEVR